MIINDARQQIVLPYRADVENLLHHMAKRYEHKGRPYLILPHIVETVGVLRNLGIAAPSPIRHYYGWAGGSPFDSQRATADMLVQNRRAYVLSEMGVGKTRAVLYAYDYLRETKRVGKLLVAAPLSTLVSVWENEIFENFPHLRSTVLYGEKRKRLKLLSVDSDVYIINHDGLAVIREALWNRPDIDVITIDELATYRNNRNARWKVMRPFSERAKYCWGLTGSPTPNEPTDAYGQVKLLTPQRVGYSFKSFKERTMRQLSAFRWIARPEALDIVYETMQPSVRFTRDQCFDLPPTTYSVRDIQMTEDSKKHYAKMFRELAIQVKGHEITAANEGVKLSKLLQISAGFAYDSDGDGNYIGGAARIKEILEIIEETQHKVIIFAGFRYLVDLYHGVLARKLGQEVVAKVHGDVPKADRDRIFIEFQRSAEPRVLIAHPRTMAHGLTLTQAATIVWASPIASLEIFEQANARITRSGQRNQTHIIMLQATKAEKSVYSRLRTKAKMQGALLDLFEEGSSATLAA